MKFLSLEYIISWYFYFIEKKKRTYEQSVIFIFVLYSIEIYVELI